MKRFDYIKKHSNMLIFAVIFVLTLISIINSLTSIYATSSLVKDGKVCVPVIMYHQVKAKGLGKDVISPEEFENDLKYLAENNYTTITMSQLIDFVYEGAELPENPIILSFDDGYLSNYVNVFPLLKKYNMKIVMSIIGKSTDDFSKVVDNNIEHAHITWDQVKEMSDSGYVEIQNHSYNLHKISKSRYGSGQNENESLESYKEVLTNDISLLQSKVEEVTNKAPNTFAYPYGKYNNNTDEILRKLGIKATLSVKYGVNIFDRDNPNPDKLFGLKRICRAHTQSIGKVLRDGMETLKYSSE